MPAHHNHLPRIASIGLGAALVMLCACALLSAVFGYRAGAAATRATEVSDALEEARYAVGSEESLERKYRLEPSPQIRLQHQQAGTQLIASLEQVRAFGVDVASDDNMIAAHRQYMAAIARMFAAVDAGDTALATRIDSDEIDPLFDAIQTQIVAAAAKHRVIAVKHLQSLADIQRNVLVITPLVFIAGMALVAFFGLLLARYAGEVKVGLIRQASAIRRSELRLRALIQNTSDIVLICTPAGRITYQSPTAETAWGYRADELLGTPLDDLVHAADRPALQQVWQRLEHTPGKTLSIELQLRKSDGSWRDIDLILTNLIQEPATAGWVVTARDITEHKAFERQLTQRAFYDLLTGLPNRVLFHDRLNQALARAVPLGGRISLLFLDLDNFKHINDSLGHQVGDRLLAEAALRLRSCVDGGTTVARLGGDEFVILLDHVTNDTEPVLLAARINQRFAEPFNFEGHDFTVTVSIGIALGNAEQRQADHMLRDADVAMYRAKSGGKARYVVFDATMQTGILARLQLESDLRASVRQGELRLHYQPIMALESGKVVGVEALVRWQHPKRGLIPPAEFIPQAEESGLIVEIGQFVLVEACRQVAAWHRQYPLLRPLTASVNLSPRQFQQPDLLAMVKRALQEAGLPPASLKLEITESVLMDDVEAAIGTLRQLRELGIQLAIDDFGTGYSSLAYLKRLPLDTLKVDRSFVSGIGQHWEDTAIVRTVISLAKSLNLTTTAEGIETAEQSALLRAWGCDRGQGYYFAQPVDVAGFAEFLKIAAAPGERAALANHLAPSADY